MLEVKKMAGSYDVFVVAILCTAVLSSSLAFHYQPQRNRERHETTFGLFFELGGKSKDWRHYLNVKEKYRHAEINRLKEKLSRVKRLLEEQERDIGTLMKERKRNIHFSKLFHTTERVELHGTPVYSGRCTVCNAYGGAAWVPTYKGNS